MRAPAGRLRPSLYASLVAAVTAVALLSAWHSGGHVWRQLTADQRKYAAYSGVQRRHAPFDSMGLPADVFDFYADRLKPGDRFYLQVQPGGFGRFFDLPGIFGALGRFYLLPAVQVDDVRRATVVLSYYADPGDLHLHFPTQTQAGQQPIYVSRIATP